MKHKKFKLQNFDIESYFNKVYEFKGNQNWSLPEEIFLDEKWRIEVFQTNKAYLNSVKEQLSAFDLATWSLHTKKRDPSSAIIRTIRSKYQPELLTQAWCKFYECLSKHNLIPAEAIEENNLRSFHLCEAPGGFIAALNHFLIIHYPNIQLDWQANTLNPEYEGNPLNQMIPDDRLIKHTKGHWVFGADATGDITKLYNFESISEEIQKNEKCFLITADGSVNCMDDPGDQERNVEHLHYCETITALNLLRTGGNFVLKIFTTFEESTICLLYLLNCIFVNVCIFKPITSKSGNSESYVICKNFKANPLQRKLIVNYENRSNKSMFKLSEINEEFIKQLLECSEFFMQKQVTTINDNIKNFNNKTNATRINALHTEITAAFLNQYYIDIIFYKYKLVPFNNINVFKNFQMEHVPFKLYYSSNGELKLNIKVGKKYKKICYSKFCENIDAITHLSRKNSNTLFNLSMNELEKQFDIYTNLNLPEDLNRLKNLNKDVIFINVPILCNKLAGVLFLMCNCFKICYFFKNGVILLKNLDVSKLSAAKLFFDELIAAYANLNAIKFEPDLIEIIDLNVHFVKCLRFFNNNLIKH